MREKYTPLIPSSKQFRGQNSFKGKSVIPVYATFFKLVVTLFLRYKNRVLLAIWAKIYFLSAYVSVNFVKRDVTITDIVIINIIISFENLSMIFDKRH